MKRASSTSFDDLRVDTRYANIRLVLYVDGMVLLFFAAAMTVPMLVDLASGNMDWVGFATSAAISAYVGAALALANRGKLNRIDRRTGYLLTTSVWLTACAFSSLPLLLSSLGLEVTDAVFETVSGLTTTGSTVIVGLDNAPPGLLLWRSMLQWIGGAGIVVTAILLLPSLGSGGMQLFHTESSDISENLAPHQRHLARLTLAAYASLTVACAVGYGLAGMSSFDAVNHAMTTLATGGYSTKDASIGFYNSAAIEIVGIVFMVAGALPMVWYVRLLQRRNPGRGQEGQVPVFLAILAAAVVLAVAWNITANEMSPPAALRVAAFNVASILTNTGYATADYSAWGSFAVGLFFVLMLIGGCAGSTAGAIKIFRWQILFAGTLRQLRIAASPNRVVPLRYAGRKVDPQTVESVRNFFFLYMMTTLVLSLAVMATGLDFLSSVSAVVQAMSNSGPGLGPVVGPASNFASIEPFAKWTLVAAMLLGRLEMLTIYVLLFVFLRRK